MALRQIEKEYDFKFDVENIDKIGCSELVYLSHSKIDWPIEATLGRYTISPDNVAVKTPDNGPFKWVVFYDDGELKPNNGLTLMKELMNYE